MSYYTGKQSVNASALGEFISLGFSLYEPDDHFAELYFKDKKIATYCQATLTIAQLHEDCGNFLKSLLREGQNG